MTYSDTYNLVQHLKATGNGEGIIRQWLREVHLLAGMGPSTVQNEVSSWLDLYQVRPVFSAKELAPIYSGLIATMFKKEFASAKSPKRLAKELEKAGLPYLRNSNGSHYFMHHGELQKFFIVEHIHKWKSQELSQDDFDDLLRSRA